jgi:hypothetical protein
LKILLRGSESQKALFDFRVVLAVEDALKREALGHNVFLAMKMS